MPHSSADHNSAEPSATELAAEAVEIARRWIAESADAQADQAAERLAGVLKDPNGLVFTVGFVDGVARPEDLFVAGYNLQKIARLAPRFLPWHLRAAIRIGGVLGPVVPAVVIPIARRLLRGMVGHLVVDATPSKLGPAISALRSDGARLNLNLLGETVLGEREALKRLEGTRELLERDDVDYVSIKVSSIASQLSMWSMDEAVDRVVERLTPLYEYAAWSQKNAGEKFINLDMEEYSDLELTIEVFTRLLDQPKLRHLHAGIALQAYLPDALGAMQRLQDWAAARVARGRAPITVRLVKGANLAMENVDATIHGWPRAPYDLKQDTDTNYKRVLMWALTPERTEAIRIGVAGHNLFDVAFAWRLAQSRGVTDRVDFEMLLGMATGQAAAVSRDVGGLLLYTPVVDPREFDVAISYLVRRLEENASSENFMSAVFELADDPALFERERERFMGSAEALDAAIDEVPRPRRTQDRSTEWSWAEQGTETDAVVNPGGRPAASEGRPGDRAGETAGEGGGEQLDDQELYRAADDEQSMTEQVLGLARGARPESPFDTVRVFDTTTLNDVAPATEIGAPGFFNTPDTDPALPANRAWAARLLARVPESDIGTATIDDARVSTADELDAIVETVRAAGAAWGARPATERAAMLERIALSLSANRDRLIEVMASETGKTIAEADPEVSEAIDFARYYGSKARELDAVRGAKFVPSQVIVVTPPWNFPVAIPAGGVLASLAAGSGVIIKPAHQARRTGAVMVEALWEAGVPRELLALVSFDEHDLGERLVSHDAVDRVILTGAWETARLFRSWRPELPLLAETSGKNAIIVTPSADLDLAATDVATSAFGHAGQKCSAASLVILVGSVGRSERFQRQLVDAVTSLRVGYPDDPASQVGPVIEPATGKLKKALTELGVGERWLVEPRQLDDTGRLWSPGVRTGVVAGSEFHRTEYFGPVLGIMFAPTLGDAIRLSNQIEYGLTAGLHTQDPVELGEWLTRIEAGNLYVNRGITGAIVQRQPFGGWKRSSVGPGAKVGGPNYLVGLGSWQPDSGSSSPTLHLRGLDSRITRIIEAAQSSLGYEEFDVLRRSALSDAIAWGTEFGEVKDASGLGVERNLFRYRPVPVAVRVSGEADLGDALRVVIAAVRSRSRFSLSLASGLPAAVRAVLGDLDVPVSVESDDEWIARVAARGSDEVVEAGLPRADRVRIVGSDASRLELHLSLARAVDGDPDLAIYSGAITQAGRVELLPFVREQSISITAHRFGTPDPWSGDVI
ncbi:proline dehydrogenase family protein [Okibacterium endophyticum]